MSIQRARSLRRTQTDSERRLWSSLRAGRLGAKFRRQVPIDRYIADFLSFEHRLIIEVDGGQHADQMERDAVRTAYLRRRASASCASGTTRFCGIWMAC